MGESAEKLTTIKCLSSYQHAGWTLSKCLFITVSFISRIEVPLVYAISVSLDTIVYSYSCKLCTALEVLLLTSFRFYTTGTSYRRFGRLYFPNPVSAYILQFRIVFVPYNCPSMLFDTLDASLMLIIDLN